MVLTVLMISGCTSVTVLKPGYPETTPDHVEVFLNGGGDRVEKCRAEQIGYIDTAFQWTGNMAIRTAQKKAAQMGGDFIIGSLYINNVNDGKVRAIVYRCIRD